MPTPTTKDAKQALYAVAGVADLAVSTIRHLPADAAKLRGRIPAELLAALIGLRTIDALTLLAPLAVFIGVQLAYGRLYRESEMAVFAASALGVIPTAALMGRATEELAARSGPGIGGLLNVTFGNAPELIIALFALGAGLHEVVKASLVGSILGNILLVLGMSMLAGGLRRERQHFELRAATAQSLMLLLATVALVMPARVSLT